MQKKPLNFLLLVFTAMVPVLAQAKSGYKIQLKFTGITDSNKICYLAHYYGKPLPTIYKTDSATFDKKGNAVMQSQVETLGGIYMILMEDKKTYFEFLLNDGDDMTITADLNKLPESVSTKNSPENEDFLAYVNFLKDYGKKFQAFQEEVKKAKTKEDTAVVQKKYDEVSKELNEYRKNHVQKKPNSLLASIFNAMETPTIPEEKQYLPDGKVDSQFTYRYYKQHYWDKFNFKDERLIHTPIYDGRLEEYINKLTLPIEDSMNKEADMLLAKAKGTKEVFKYTLWWLTRNAETSKIMGMDAVFVHLVENYYMKGDAFWLDAEGLEKYIDRAHKIAPNVIGNLAPELKIPDINGKEQSLHGLKAKYTLLLFWSPDCGHCLTEVPKIDSIYKASLKSKGVKIFAVRTDSDEKTWKSVIDKHNLGEWTHVHDIKRVSNFRSDYDIYSTPVIYLLDEKKIIRGKRLDHESVAQLVEMLEKKEKTSKTSK